MPERQQEHGGIPLTMPVGMCIPDRVRIDGLPCPRHVGLPSKSDNILIALIPEADTVYSSKPSQRVNPCTGSRGMFNRLTDASPSA
jgi:hypothetical protein